MVLGTEVDLCTGKHTGTYLLVLVSKGQLHGEGVGRSVDSGILERYGSGEGLTGERIESDSSLVALLHT